MGAALGFLAGAALNTLGGYGKQKMAERQQQDEHRSQLANLVVQQGIQSGDPAFWDIPEVKKLVGDKFSPDSSKMLQGLTQVMNKPLSGMPVMGQPDATQGLMKAAAPAAPGQGSAPPAGGGGGVVQAGGAAPVQQRTIDPSMGSSDDPASIRKHLDAVHIYAQQYPNNMRVQQAVKQEEAYWTGRLSDLEKQQNFQQNQARFNQAHADTEADRAQSRAIMAQNQQANNELKTIMAGLAEDREKDDQQKSFDGARKNLAGQLQNIQKMLGSANPPSADSLQPLLQKYNAQLKSLKQRADKLGIDYDDAEFTPVTSNNIQDHPLLSALTMGALFGGTHAELGATDTGNVHGAAFDQSKTTKPAVGNVVSLKGQKVKITKLHADGKTFDYEPAS
jgi:hypothetical protein